MLDVHPPHASTHTWRDFLTHIATIVVGLLIAIGLEQTVEAIHHRNERNALIQEMHAEAEHNIAVLTFDIKTAAAAKNWARLAILAVQQAPSTPGITTITLPSGVAVIEGHQPSRAVWDIAKANGKAALVPDNLAEVFNHQAFEADGFDRAVVTVKKFQSDLDALEARVHAPLDAGVTLHLSAQDREELIHALSNNVAAASSIQYEAAGWQAAADAILHNVQSRDEVDAYADRVRAAIPK